MISIYDGEERERREEGVTYSRISTIGKIKKGDQSIDTQRLYPTPPTSPTLPPLPPLLYFAFCLDNGEMFACGNSVCTLCAGVARDQLTFGYSSTISASSVTDNGWECILFAPPLTSLTCFSILLLSSMILFDEGSSPGRIAIMGHPRPLGSQLLSSIGWATSSSFSKGAGFVRNSLCI